MADDAGRLADILQDFTVVDATYKTVSSHLIEAEIWMPKLDPAERSQPRPICVSWHGGAFVTGSRRLHAWLPRWQAELMRARGAIMVCPDYRLAPEASGRDILADIADLLHWLLTHLPALAVKHGLTADLRRTLVVGDSAGGWLALQTALRYGSGVLGFPGAGSPLEIVAVISKFGMLNPAATKPMPADPPVPLNLVEQHRATVSPGAVVTSALFPERGDLMACVLQHALAYELLGGDPDMNLVALLGHIKTPPPPTWLFHGTDDANVDFAETRAFAARVKDVYGPDVQLKETYVPGAHGVGNDDSMDGGWIRDGLEWIGQYWR